MFGIDGGFPVVKGEARSADFLKKRQRGIPTFLFLDNGLQLAELS